MPLDQAIANATVDHLDGNGAAPSITGPLELRLMESTGDASTNGTEVSGGSYVPQSITLAAASGGTATNSGDINFTNMPAVSGGVPGFEIWDSTPQRVWLGTFTSSPAVASGQTFTVFAGDLTVGLT